MFHIVFKTEPPAWPLMLSRISEFYAISAAYDATNHNCEHFVYYVMFGEHVSFTVQRVNDAVESAKASIRVVSNDLIAKIPVLKTPKRIAVEVNDSKTGEVEVYSKEDADARSHRICELLSSDGVKPIFDVGVTKWKFMQIKPADTDQ